MSDLSRCVSQHRVGSSSKDGALLARLWPSLGFLWRMLWHGFRHLESMTHHSLLCLEHDTSSDAVPIAAPLHTQSRQDDSV